MSKDTALYRQYNANRELLYIGISCNVGSRTSQHKKATWFKEIAIISIEHFPDRESALAAEILAIKKEKPLYNFLHSKVRIAKNKRSIAITRPINEWLVKKAQEAKMSISAFLEKCLVEEMMACKQKHENHA